ncbi:MAG: nuclear transport factor 2 family protein [Betaproteobacteria bacterium]|nr:nuclear transport factor 2 family protein [Betaproteobacteria bacterium]
MATVNTLHTGHLIDAAFLTRTRPSSRPELRLASSYKDAMAQRLHQLQTALGDEQATTSNKNMTCAAEATPADSRQFCTASVLLASLASAVLGASAMWFALTANDSRTEPSLVPVAALAAPAVAAPSPIQVHAEPILAAVADETQIENMLESWLQAWRDRDVAAYLDAYGSEFMPADGSSHSNWAAARTKKLASAGAIDVQIRDVTITRKTPDLFKVSFHQDYAAGSYREVGRAKTLLIARTDGNWKIAREMQD